MKNYREGGRGIIELWHHCFETKNILLDLSSQNAPLSWMLFL